MSSQSDRCDSEGETPQLDRPERELERQRRARRTAEQTWKEFLHDLLVRTAVIALAILVVFVLLRLVFG